MLGATAAFASKKLCEFGSKLLNLSELQVRFDPLGIYKKDR